MLTIDGSQGEGGGQIIRTSVALSLVTGQPVTLKQIRARRSKPGLQRQHLTAVRAAAEIGSAETDGVRLGSSQLVFRPGAVQSGGYRFRIGTAGSASLVLQTVLPALLLAESESQVEVEGGTHNPLAPTVDFLRESYARLLGRIGPTLEIQLNRAGFYPAGGGRITATIKGVSAWRPLELISRGRLTNRRVVATVARLPRSIADRECGAFRRYANWPANCFESEEVESNGPGNVIRAELTYDRHTEVLTAFGKKGVKAEDVARTLWREVKRYQSIEAPVGEHLADQLMLLIAVAARQGVASRFLTGPLSGHSETHLVILREFLHDVILEAESQDDGSVLVVARPA